jgi:dTDP-4-dehydrorhamnose reductase
VKIWIVGANGFLGSTLVKLCQKKGLNCIATTKNEADITHLENLKKFCRNTPGITHIINCAAYTDVDGAEKTQDLAFAINATGPENLGIIAHTLGAHLLHVSTDYVFGDTQNHPFEEHDQPSPLGVYGLSKLRGEENLLSVFPSACIVRTSWVFGKGGKNFISSVLNKLQTEPRLQAASDQRGRPTFVDDLAETLLALLCHSGVYHFANLGDVSRFDIAQTIQAHARSLDIPIKCQEITAVSAAQFTGGAKRPFYSVLSTRKIEKLLGEAPRHWEHTLREFLSHEA